MKAKANTKNRKNGRYHGNAIAQKELNLLKRKVVDCVDIVNSMVYYIKKGKVLIGPRLAEVVLLTVHSVKPAASVQKLEEQLAIIHKLFRITLTASNKGACDLWRFRKNIARVTTQTRKYTPEAKERGRKKLDFLFIKNAAIKNYYANQSKQVMSNDNLQGMIQDV